MKIVGRAFGLGDAEMQAGVPTWAWALLAVGAGAIAGAVYYPEIRKRFG